MKIVSKEKQIKGGLLADGEHLCTIESIKEDVAAPTKNGAFKDLTPQIAICFKNEDGIITQWVNTKGFMSKEDYPDGKAPKGFEFRSSENGNEQYAVDIKTAMRVENTAKSEIGMKILGELANTAGFETGEDLDLEDLLGREVRVVVHTVNGQKRVHYTAKAEA
jgi:hypothetical protein